MSLSGKASYFCRSAAQGMWHAPFVHVIAVAAIAIALFSAGLASAAARLVDALLASLGGEVELTVYLAPDTTPHSAAELAQTLTARAGAQAKVVLPEQALERLRQELGELGGALEGLEENPLPPSVELELPAGKRTAAELRSLAQRVRELPMVTQVDYGEEALSRLEAISRLLRLGGWLAFAIVLLTTAVIASATLQLAIYSRREEIEIQKLVGATDRFVKAPFLLEGLLQGLFGSALALLGLWGFRAAVGAELKGAFAFLLPEKPVALLDLRSALELLGLGAGLGLSGSLLAVRRFLRV